MPPVDSYGTGAAPADLDVAQPCRHCGVSTGRILQIVSPDSDRPLCWFYICDDCDITMFAELADLKATFEALLAEGMSRERANDVMIRWFVNDKIKA